MFICAFDTFVSFYMQHKFMCCVILNIRTIEMRLLCNISRN
nr:MAG TPA: hypothetical protein [Caudoviricetes sp.]